MPVHQGSGLVMGATVLVVLRAFANGGTSLTGVEAISNTVNVFREAARPQRPSGADPDGLHPRILAGRRGLACATSPTPPRTSMNTRRCFPRSPGRSSATG